MAWQPEEDGLRQLSEYLKNSLSGHDRNKQKEAEQVSLPDAGQKGKGERER